MAISSPFGNRDRLLSGAAVTALHLALGYVLLVGLGVADPPGTAERLKLFDITEPPPPPEVESVAQEERTPEPEGEAAPPAMKAQPAPVVVPPPRIKVERPPPVVAAPVAGEGAQPTAGAAPIPGPGTGAGGQGTGTGSGGSGNGTGGGGAATKPRLVSGAIANADYPNAAYRARAEGTVTVSYWVGTDGRATRCRIVRSSGNSDLDSTTCRLVVERYRYEPARNVAGRPVPYLTGWQQRWWIGGR